MSEAGGPPAARGGKPQSWHIGLAASPSLRQGPASPLAQLLREIEPCLRYLGAEIYAIEGVLHTIIRCGLLRTLPPGCVHGMPSGRLGGLVDIGAAVVERRVVGVAPIFGDKTDAVAGRLGLDAKVDAVIYLLDPYDPTTRLPETLALKRECVVKGKPFLATAASAREWFSLHAKTAAEAEPDRAGSRRLLRTFIDDDEAGRIDLPPRGHQTVALIAHNECKLKLAQFADDHRAFLATFGHRFGTGTSAGMLNLVFGEGVPCPKSAEEMNVLLDGIRHARFLDEVPLDEGETRADRPEPERSQTPQPRVEELASGPEGGDLQAAEAILMGICDTAVFFEDPSNAHEHDADIEVFERAARVWNMPARRLTGWGVTCLHDYASASTWARLWMGHGGTPTTLTHAFRARYGVELVVVEPARPDNPAAAWKAVVSEAAWYVFSAIMSAGQAELSAWQSGPGTPQTYRVVVPPGGGMDDVIDRMKQLIGAPHQDRNARNDDLDRVLRAVSLTLGFEPHRDRMIAQAKAFLARKKLEEPAQPNVMSDVLVVAPATGTFGSPVPGVEANVHADELAAIFDAEAVSCAPTAFKAAPLRASPTKPARPPFELHWDATDLLVLTCDAVDEGYLSERGQVPIPDGLGEQMQRHGAVGHLAGLFIDSSGNPVESFRYKRCGIAARTMRDIAQLARDGGAGKDSVLIATQDSKGRRLQTIGAVLEGKYASTLITDTTTARALINAAPRM